MSWQELFAAIDDDPQVKTIDDEIMRRRITLTEQRNAKVPGSNRHAVVGLGPDWDLIGFAFVDGKRKVGLSIEGHSAVTQKASIIDSRRRNCHAWKEEKQPKQ